MPDRIGPGYQDADVQIRSTREFNLHTSASVTETGDGAIEAIVGDYFEGLLNIDITAVTGTSPTIDFVVESYINGAWRELSASIAQQTGVAAVTTAITNFGEKIRLSWTVGGTAPDFTFSAAFVAKT